MAQLLLITLILLISSCSSLQTKRIAISSQFRFTKSQPRFHDSFSQLFDKPDNSGKKITRSNEVDYFESDFDRTPLKDRLPIALGFLAFVSIPFIIGLIYLYTNK